MLPGMVHIIPWLFFSLWFLFNGLGLSAFPIQKKILRRTIFGLRNLMSDSDPNANGDNNSTNDYSGNSTGGPGETGKGKEHGKNDAHESEESSSKAFPQDNLSPNLSLPNVSPPDDSPAMTAFKDLGRKGGTVSG